MSAWFPVQDGKVLIMRSHEDVNYYDGSTWCAGKYSGACSFVDIDVL